MVKSLNKMTFGALKNKLNGHFPSNEYMENALQEALDKRNFLAHDFFDSHSGKVTDVKELEKDAGRVRVYV